MNLVFTSDKMAGYRRVRHGTGFSFVLPNGSVLSSKPERQRLLALAIPPAYEDVWICLVENGHLQATGIDARKRKQYRYHPEWMNGAADRKFENLIQFARALPKIRNEIRKELAKPLLSRSRVVAGVVALLDATGYRIGNSRYAKDNGSFGISSLLMRHLKEDGGQFHLHFRGKSGLDHHTDIVAPRVTRLISELQELPGQKLFRYEDEEGQWHDIETTDINGWLKEAGGGDYTAKQFRTWKATASCARHLSSLPPPESKTEKEKAVRAAIKATAQQLNHTPATCRKYYIPPSVIRSYENGELYKIMKSSPPRLRQGDGSASLHAEERKVFKIISSPQVKSISVTSK